MIVQIELFEMENFGLLVKLTRNNKFRCCKILALKKIRGEVK